MVDKIAVIGTGLMGGSLALALKGAGCAREVAVWDVSGEERRQAAALGVGDRACDDAAAAARGACFVFLATPMKEMGRALSDCAPGIGPGTVVSDLGSAKVKVIEDLSPRVPAGAFFVGGHPMAGSEHSGVRFADAGMFAGRYYVLTPTADTPPEALQRLHSLLAGIGARVITMDAETHDRACATVSHVPHLLSLLLMRMASLEREKNRSIYAIAAGGFRDMTRIAGSDPSLWVDIIDENRQFVIAGLKEYGRSLEDLVEVLEGRRDDDLAELFESSREAREELSRKEGREVSDLHILSLPVPDEPGVISRITTAVGSLGINIEDIRIVHPLEGETGTLHLSILGEAEAREVAAHLASLGHATSTEKT